MVVQKSVQQQGDSEGAVRVRRDRNIYIYSYCQKEIESFVMCSIQPRSQDVLRHMWGAGLPEVTRCLRREVFPRSCTPDSFLQRLQKSETDNERS